MFGYGRPSGNGCNGATQGAATTDVDRPWSPRAVWCTRARVSVEVDHSSGKKRCAIGTNASWPSTESPLPTSRREQASRPDVAGLNSTIAHVRGLKGATL